MKSLLLLGGALALGIGGWVATRPESVETALSAPEDGTPIVTVALPDTLTPEAEIGKRGFDAVCSACHGDNAAGREGVGPPLVHEYYEPSHHADMAFVLAVQNGVRAHHWRFGDMPPQEGLTRADVAAITTYVRALQRANGIN